jgi:hypothetical protein
MNSAMMPLEGRYHCFELTIESFINTLEKYEQDEEIEVTSFIGYPENIKILEYLTGKEYQCSRESLKQLRAGDIMLVMRLRYRVNPQDKGNFKKLNHKDFDFFKVDFLGGHKHRP